MNVSSERLYSAVRFSLGLGSTKDDIETVIDITSAEVHRLRQLD